MDQETRGNMKRIAQEAEIRVAKSILRWKYKKEGRHIPPQYRLENESRQIAGRAHAVLAERGKTVFNELKRVYKKKG